MRHRRSAYGAIGLAVASLALMSCGGPGDAPKATPTTSPTVQSSQATATPSPTSSAPDSSVPAGIVLAKCLPGTDGVQQLDFIDPATGQVNESRFFVVQTQTFHTYGACGSGATPGSIKRSAYDGGFNTLAAHQVLANDGYHAGVIPQSNSLQNTTTEFTDLSGITEDGFGAAGQQSPGAFGPDGRLYFVQQTPGKSKNTFQLMAVNPAGGQPQAVAASDDIRNVDVTDTGLPVSFGLYFLPGYSQPLTDFTRRVVFSPDGKWMFEQERTDGYLIYGAPNKPSKIEVNVGEPVPAPFQYVSKTAYYGLSEDGELVLAKIAGNKVTTKSLLPPTDGEIIDPTLSPDGKVITFVLKKETGSGVTLYTVPASGGQPTKVMDIDNRDVSILAWTNGQ